MPIKFKFGLFQYVKIAQKWGQSTYKDQNVLHWKGGQDTSDRYQNLILSGGRNTPAWQISGYSKWLQ